jgi:serine/threonine protein kinase
MREAIVLSSIRHPGLIVCNEVTYTTRTLTMKMEYGGISLREWGKHRTPDKLAQVPGLFRQLVEVVYDLWVQGIQHVDIVPENVLVDEEGHLRLIDIGMCSFRTGIQTDGSGVWSDAFGSWGYAAPEIVCMDQVRDGTAVWNLAMMWVYLWTDKNPVEQQAESLSRRNIARVLRDFRNELWSRYIDIEEEKESWLTPDFDAMTIWEERDRMSIHDVYTRICGKEPLSNGPVRIPVPLDPVQSNLPQFPVQPINRTQSRVIPYAYRLWQSLRLKEKEVDPVTITACLAWAQLIVDMLDDRIIRNWCEIMETDPGEVTRCMLQMATQKEWRFLL